MDVDKDMSQYWQLLQSQKQNLKKARNRQGQRPRDRKPREQAYMEFMMSLMATKSKTQEQGHFIASSFVPPAYLPCTTPLAQLTPTAIKDLKLETHHRGSFLLLRVITPPNRMTALLVLAEDDQGDVVLLQIYQQEGEEAREATDVVDMGTILLVKEPYFKLTASGDYSLRVDHLSDVVRIAKNDHRIPKTWQPRVVEVEESAELSKSRGDAAIGAHKYWQAIREYSDAIAQGAQADRIEVIKRNRSLAYLKTQNFDAALSDTGFPSFGPVPSEKALFRAAEALYYLGRFDECQQVVEKLCDAFPNNQQASIVLARARSRCMEQRTGDYDFKLLQREAKKLRPPQLDHATYIGPVEVRQAPGKGRGLFTTAAVKAGDLLLCEKAFSHAYVTEKDVGNSKTALLLNIETDKGFMGGQADLITLIVQKLHCNPSVAPAFVSLHHGTYQPTNVSLVDGTPIVDTFLVERIMSLNVFGCPLSSFNTHKDFLAGETKEATAFHSCGIWTQASYINHSCTSTARRAFIGDMMIVRATQDLEPGTEITFWYKPPSDNDKKKMQDELSGWGFACDCAICQDEKKTKASVLAQRRKIQKDLLKACKTTAAHGTNLGTVERLLKALNETYARPADEVPRISLRDPQLLLTRMYVAQNKKKKALTSVEQVLILLGFIVAGCDGSSMEFRVVKWGLVMDCLVEVFVHASKAFEGMSLWSDSKRADAYARLVYKMVVGEDTSYESVYG